MGDDDYDDNNDDGRPLLHCCFHVDHPSCRASQVTCHCLIVKVVFSARHEVKHGELDQK